MKMKGNAFYAQSGGVTAVINASAAGLIETARKHPDRIGTVLAGRNGILGGLNDDLFDTAQLSDAELAALKHTPGGAFGSCRYKLKSLTEQRTEYEKLLATFARHDIRFFFYNGGNDSMDTANKVAQFAAAHDYPLTCIGIPKTVDNDLPLTDCCPGFGSVAKYVAVSTREAALDVRSMAATSTKVFILEVMGRHAGWIAAAGGLAAEREGDAPHLILLPERAFERAKVMAAVKDAVQRWGYCVIVLSEGVKDPDGRFLAEAGGVDAFGHAQLGGAAAVLAGMIRDDLKLKYHFAIADYLQRSARHLASKTDLQQAIAVGRDAVKYALRGRNAVMVAIERLSDSPYKWRTTPVPLADVANVERKLPDCFISADGLHITEAARNYLLPLIAGEAWPRFKNGLPVHALFMR